MSPPGLPCNTPLQMSVLRLSGRSSMAIPKATPIGLDRLKITFEMMKLLLVSEDWAMLSPREKAMTALWTMTAMKMERSWPEFSWSPMATPSKTEWKERANSSMILRSEDCWNTVWDRWE